VDRYIYRIGSTTNVLGRPPTFYINSGLRSAGCRFASVYAVTYETAKSVANTAQTTAGFRGVVWSQRLWIDFDEQEPAVKAIRFLKGEGYDFVVYTTGNRGCHIGVARDAQPSHTLPQQDKTWVSTNCPGADLSLYWHLHLIRLPGAIHEKTNKPKKLIQACEGRSLQLPPWFPEDSDVGGITQRREEEPKQRSSIFMDWQVSSNLQPTGNRRQLVILSQALRRCGVSKEEALWVIMEVNMGFTKSRSQDELERMIEWAYNENI
jgi:hypothetical protein